MTMKGIVFTEFLEIVEDTFSPDIADEIIEASHLENDGAYTAVGTYHHAELIELISHLSKQTKVDIPLLVKTFGIYLFGRFVALYPVFFENNTSCFGFLQMIENHVHVEVKKLYPDAELPSFKTRLLEENVLEMIYQSQRPFAPLAEGLMLGCIQYYHEEIDINITDLSADKNKHVKFVLSKKS